MRGSPRPPRDDLISFGVEVEVDGRRMTDDELTGFCFNLFIGGLDTVSTNLGLIFRHLAERTDHQATLRANSAMIPDAILALMRAYPCILNSRQCVEDTSIGGVTIRRGDKVMLPTFLAGRDPDRGRCRDRILSRQHYPASESSSLLEGMTGAGKAVNSPGSRRRP
jgi:cytochrome P450